MDWYRPPGSGVCGRRGRHRRPVVLQPHLVAVAAIFRKVVTPDFHTPTTLMAGAVFAATVLTARGLSRRRAERDPDAHQQPGPVPAASLLVLTSMVGAVLWFALL